MGRDEGLLVDVTAGDGQQAPPSQQNSPAVSTPNNCPPAHSRTPRTHTYGHHERQLWHKAAQLIRGVGSAECYNRASTCQS